MAGCSASRRVTRGDGAGARRGGRVRGRMACTRHCRHSARLLARGVSRATWRRATWNAVYPLRPGGPGRCGVVEPCWCIDRALPPLQPGSRSRDCTPRRLPAGRPARRPRHRFGGERGGLESLGRSRRRWPRPGGCAADADDRGRPGARTGTRDRLSGSRKASRSRGISLHHPPPSCTILQLPAYPRRRTRGSRLDSGPMKTQRHAAILKIVRSETVASQEQLRELLKGEGFDVTQATLSRDIRELGLAKVAAPDGGAHYAPPPERGAAIGPHLGQLLPAVLVSVDGVGPLLVVKTPAGGAQALGLALDAAGWMEIIGTIAGDDAVLVITKSERARRAVQTRIKELAGIPD